MEKCFCLNYFKPLNPPHIPYSLILKSQKYPLHLIFLPYLFKKNYYLTSMPRKLTKTLKYYVSDDKRIVKSSFLCRIPYTICYGFFYVFHFWPVIMSFNKPIVFCLLHKHNKKGLLFLDGANFRSFRFWWHKKSVLTKMF